MSSPSAPSTKSTAPASASMRRAKGVKPCSAAQSSLLSSTEEAPSVSGVELPAVMVASASSFLPKTGLSLERDSMVESGQVRIPAHAEVSGGEVVEEAGVPGRGEVPVRGHGELVLSLPGDVPCGGGDRLVLAHAQTRPRLARARGLRAEIGRTDLRGDLRPGDHGLGAGEFEQDLAHRVVDDDRGVGGRVDAGGDAGFDLAGVDLVVEADDGLESRGAGLAEIEGRGGRGQG